MLEVGERQRVLGREVSVEAGLRDARLGDDLIDARGAQSLPVEQAVRDLKELSADLLGRASGGGGHEGCAENVAGWPVT